MALLEFSIHPLDKGESVGDFVARCLKIIEESGLNYQCHPMGTVIEGEIDEVIGTMQQCIAELTTDCNRIECAMKLDYRKGYMDELKTRIPRIEKRLNHPVKRS